MKKKLITTCVMLLSLFSVAFAILPLLTEHVSGTERFRHSIYQTFNTSSPQNPATLYYGLSTTVVSPAAVELKINSNPIFVSQGSKSVSSAESFKSFRADGLTPSESYNLYSILIDDNGEESAVFEKVIPSINYITEAFYLANKVTDFNDDKIIIKFHNDFTYEPGYTLLDIHVGYFNTTDYESLANNPPSEGALNPITVLTNGSFSNIVNIDSKTIELTVDSSALALYNTEAQWLVNNPTYSRVNIIDTNAADTFEMDGGLFFLPMTYNIITTESYPELIDFTYQNSNAIASDTMELKFNQSISGSTITNDDIIITFDDDTNGSYNTADLTFTSSDFTKSIADSTIIINFTSTGVDKIKLLKSNSIAKVNINNNVANSFTIDPIKNNKTLDMPGQNSNLSEIMLHSKSIDLFSPTQYSYEINIRSDKYAELVDNPSEYIVYETMDSNALVTISNPSTNIYDITVTSEDTKESSTYTVILTSIETGLNDIQVNGTTIAGFSSSMYEYTFNVDSSFRVNSVDTNPIVHTTLRTLNYSGNQPGTYVITIIASQEDIENTYTLTYISEVERSSSSGSSSDSNNTPSNSETVESTKSTKQLTTNITSDIKKLVDDDAKLNDPSEIEKLATTLDELASGVDTREEALQASNDLVNLTGTLSKSLIDGDGNSDNLFKIINEVAKSMTGVISKFEDPNDKLLKLKTFTDSLQIIKNSELSSKILDKSISDILNDTSRSLTSVKLTKSLTSDDNVNTFPITKEIIDKTSLDSKEKIDELNKLANNYFKDENYINIKKEVQFNVDSTEDLTNISLDKEAVKTLKSSNVNTVNIKVGDTTVALPTELLDSEDDYQLVVKKLSPTSQLKKDETVKTNVNELTNNKKYVDVSILKNGSELEDLKKPVELRLETSHFGIGDVDSKTETLTILRYNDATGIWEAVGGIYDPITKTISVHRIHLSKYTVMKTKKTITDVENEEVKSEVLSLLGKGVISDKNANMKDNITREEFVTWLGKSYGLTSSTASAPFEDLDPDSESYKFVASVYEQGIISGKSKDTFGTSDFMTYEEAAVVLSNTLTSLDNKKINNSLTQKLSQMGEGVNVSDWAQDEIALIIELGIMDDSVALNADGYISREEAAAIFDKFYS